jgi:hypothetical protein
MSYPLCFFTASHEFVTTDGNIAMYFISKPYKSLNGKRNVLRVFFREYYLKKGTATFYVQQLQYSIMVSCLQILLFA